MKKIIICDIDGVLNNIKGVVYLYHNKSIERFNQKSTELPANQLMFDFLKIMIELKYEITFLTGRPEKFRYQTMDLLVGGLGINLATKCNLIMRKTGDVSSSVKQKEDWIENNIKWDDILMAFDDREDIREMFVRHGVVCFSNSPDYMNPIYKNLTTQKQGESNG